MRRCFTLCALSVWLCVSFVTAPLSAQETSPPEGYIYEWENYIELALEESEPSEYVFVYFAGSDWCPHCMRFEEEVLDAPVFRRYLEGSFIPVLIDSPRYYTLSPAQKAYNDFSLDKYEVQFFPTVVILDSEGEVVATVGYEQQGANGFIKTLKNALQ